MKDKMVDLRQHLFETLEGLMDKDEPMELDRAKAVSEVAQTLINSAKVEVDFIKATGRLHDSGFISSQKPELKPIGSSGGKSGGAA